MAAHIKPSDAKHAIVLIGIGYKMDHKSFKSLCANNLMKELELAWTDSIFHSVIDPRPLNLDNYPFPMRWSSKGNVRQYIELLNINNIDYEASTGYLYFKTPEDKMTAMLLV